MDFHRMRSWTHKVLFLIGLALGCSNLTHGAFGASGMVQYNRDIRPILNDNCFACHGPDEKKRAAELRLDIREAALNKQAIVPGKPDESSIIKRILSTDENEVMPPPTSHKTLTQSQKDLLKAWVAEGAEYQGHWAYITPVKPELPQVRNPGWVRNPIDRFVLSELERRGVEPSPDADLRSLIRRVTLDLTGLPPRPEDVESILNDPSPERYENYVDELLSREEWGEHRGRYWLDYARYADTHGIHFDNYREMWSYRQWVIKAFNRNMPFDQFTIEQLAGDLLPEATLDQRIASGFNRCNITTNEGGAISEEYQVLYTRDRVETTSLVWMGLTMGCAVCHDHKFDPIAQREFYQMAAFFNNTTQNAMDGNIKDTPPIVPVPLEEDRERFSALDGLIAQAKQAVESRRSEARSSFDAFLADNAQRDAILASELPASDVLDIHLPLLGSDPKVIEGIFQGQKQPIALASDAVFAPGHLSDSAWQVKAGLYPTIEAGDIERDQPFTISMWVKPAADNQGGSLLARMDDGADFRGWDVWLENGNIGTHIINKWPDNALKVVSNQRLTASRYQHVTIAYDGSSKAQGVKIFIDGKQAPVKIASDKLSDSIRTKVPLRLGSRHATAPTNDAKIQDLRMFRRVLNIEELQAVAQLPRRQYLIAKANRSNEENEELFQWYLATRDADYTKLTQNQQQLVDEKAAILQRGTIAHVMNEKNEMAKAWLLTRGDYDKRTDEVAPQTPAVLNPWREEYPKNRLGLAKWLLDESNPLMTRVTVNRFWQEVFGNGIVVSAGDFGVTGQLPTHPELLDYLAISFREDDWNVKNLFRTIVTSSTYRQSASVTNEKLAMDPANKLLARGPRFRMDAEMIRDSALSASGLLVQKIGGPSVRPYQPPGVWEAVAMPGSNTRDYQADKGEGLYRRSLYTFLKRSAPPPSMEVFNATAREVCTVRRERTNTPLQALVTMNDVQFIEAARILAHKGIAANPNGTDPAARLQWIAARVLSRPLRGEELGVLQASLNEVSAYYQANTEAAKELLAVGATRSPEEINPAELASWTMTVNILMNLDEAITK
jgi:mono/diheme cytochrome c family protein